MMDMGTSYIYHQMIGQGKGPFFQHKLDKNVSGGRHGKVTTSTVNKGM